MLLSSALGWKKMTLIGQSKPITMRSTIPFVFIEPVAIAIAAHPSCSVEKKEKGKVTKQKGYSITDKSPYPMERLRRTSAEIDFI